MPYRLIPRRLRERVGRRGLILLLFGLAWVMQGSAYFLVGDMSSGGFLHDHLPTWVMGGLWITSGGISVATALMRRPGADRVGFHAVSAMPMLLGASYLVGAVTFGIAGDPLWMVGLLGVAIYGVVTLALGVISSWPEPPTLEDGGDE